MLWKQTKWLDKDIHWVKTVILISFGEMSSGPVLPPLSLSPLWSREPFNQN